jgi:hypothetical protein
MRAILIGLAAAAAMAAATPASAQGFYFGAPGVSVGVGAGPYYRDRDYYDGPRYRTYRYRGYDDSYAYGRGCRTITIRRDDGSVRRIRRCD